MDPIRIEKKLDFDLDSLLAPIPGNLPAGAFLQGEGTYDRIREARSQAELGGSVSGGSGVAWSDVAGLCLDALQRSTKDIQIAGWLTEAWLHLYGLGGLAQGLEVVADLCEYYWDPLHPGAAEGGSWEHRLAPIAWLNEELSAAVRTMVLTAPDSSEAPAFYEELLNDLESAADAAAELEGVLNERCAEQAPSLGELTNTLDSIREQIAGILPQRDPEPVATERPAASDPAAPVIPSASDRPPSGSGPIRNRNDAYRRLADAADFLARTDPHSPAPYLVRRAIAWGDMPLGDLVANLIRNDGDRSEINRLLGVSKPENL
jgi:type VI secretion system protein ImpA